MRKFVEMLQQMYKRHQVAKLNELRQTKRKVGFFATVYNRESMDTAVNLMKQLRRQEIQVECICIFDNASNFPFMKEYDIRIVTAGSINVDELGIEEMLILNSYLVWPEAMYKYFEKLGLSTYIIEDSEIYNSKRNDALTHIMDYYDGYLRLTDKISKEAYLGVIRNRLTGQLQDFSFAIEPQYMLIDYMPQKGDIVIDGGAYDGATAKDFVALGASVYSFEMDEKNYHTCIEKNYDEHIVYENAGLWSCKQDGKYNSQGTGSSINDKGEEVAKLIDIDTYVRDNNLPRIDYIKLDVEGAELEVLKGAFLTISKFKPKLAISAYHKREDIYTLIKYISTLRPDYKFAFRHYLIDGRNYYLNDDMKSLYRRYDLDYMVPTPWEYILYAR